MSRWDNEIWYNPAGSVGKVSSRISTYIESIFNFDEAAFGLATGESSLMDPQQRMPHTWSCRWPPACRW